MIDIKISYNKNKDIHGFILSGHSGYSEEGNDIVCSAVSILVINTINCVELFTKQLFTCIFDDENGGYIDYILLNTNCEKTDHDAQLLLKSMVHGLEDIKTRYGIYINISNREV